MISLPVYQLYSEFAIKDIFVEANLKLLWGSAWRASVQIWVKTKKHFKFLMRFIETPHLPEELCSALESKPGLIPVCPKQLQTDCCQCKATPARWENLFFLKQRRTLASKDCCWWEPAYGKSHVPSSCVCNRVGKDKQWAGGSKFGNGFSLYFGAL